MVRCSAQVPSAFAVQPAEAAPTSSREPPVWQPPATAIIIDRPTTSLSRASISRRPLRPHRAELVMSNVKCSASHWSPGAATSSAEASHGRRPLCSTINQRGSTTQVKRSGGAPAVGDSNTGCMDAEQQQQQMLRWRCCSCRSTCAQPPRSDCHIEAPDSCANPDDTGDGAMLLQPCGRSTPSCDASYTSDDASTSGESVASDSGFSSAASSCTAAPGCSSPPCCRQRRRSSSSCSCDSLPCCARAWCGDRGRPSGESMHCCHGSCTVTTSSTHLSCRRSDAIDNSIDAQRSQYRNSGCIESDSGPDLGEVDETVVTDDDDEDEDNDVDDDDDIDEDIIGDTDDVDEDSDVLVDATANSNRDVLTTRELRLLVKYTTGFSLRRFKCPPRDCPMCMQAFYTGSDLRATGSFSQPRATSALARSQPPASGRRLRLASSHESASSKPDAADVGNGGTYYVDLSDAGVELSVSYPDESSYWRTHEQLQQQLCSVAEEQQHVPQLSWSSWPRLQADPSTLPFTIPYERWNDVPQMCLVPPVELSSFVQSHPPARPWVPLAHPERNKPTAIFSAMCYNILCDKYCTRQLYGYSPSWALNWEYRKKGIMEEIRHYSADIISLQEVETEQFHSFFLPELEQCGYQGIFAPKSRARTMSENDKRYVDGCAIFWKRNKFQLYKEQKIEFSHLAIANAEGSEDMLNRVMTKDNIGLVAVLETKEGIYDSGVRPDVHVPKHLLVATVHVVWDPEFCDVKLIQTLMLMSELKNIIENLQLNLRPGGSGKVDCSSMPMIFCGDLNSLPDSGVIEFLNAGKVSARHLEFKKYGYDMVLKTFSHTKDNDYLTHAFRLKQAYDEALMPYTNYTYDFKGIIDYVFYSEDHLNPLGVLGPIDSSWFKENKVVGCPHPHIASDHFSLLVEFEMPILTGTQKSTGGGGAAASGNAPARR